MKTLYVSDLDGTLLNSSKSLSSYSSSIINSCIEKGALFTIATARMVYGCDYRITDLKMNVPGIVTNGVFLYDFSNRCYLSAEIIPSHSSNQVIELFAAHGLSCFVYTFSDNQLSLYYGHKSLQSQVQYYSDRALANCRRIELVPNLAEQISEQQVVYLAYTGTEEQLGPIHQDVLRIPDISCAFYLNIYNGLYCLEVFSTKASKRAALVKLKEILGYDELVVFGDNHNDLSMFEIAQRSYAPENSLPKIKTLATAVIADNDHDGVARFLADEFSLDILR